MTSMLHQVGYELSQYRQPVRGSGLRRVINKLVQMDMIANYEIVNCFPLIFCACHGTAQPHSSSQSVISLVRSAGSPPWLYSQRVMDEVRTVGGCLTCSNFMYRHPSFLPSGLATR